MLEAVEAVVMLALELRLLELVELAAVVMEQ
jgi:hypothetical protein